MANRRRRRAPGRKKKEQEPPQAPLKPKTGLETSADTRLVNALESDPGFFKDPLIGRTIGKCKVEKLIGEGRTAVVYRARYAALRRPVALKVLLPRMTKYPAVVRVFQQEGRAVAALDHGNVLKIYDVGQDGEYHYLVLELLDGKPLLQIVEEAKGGRLPVDEALDYTRQAAAGLAAAHRKKIVHRDIKPQNLVVEPDGTLKIVDFGLAAEAEGAFSGGRLGTPHYMSPEQCKGDQAQTASDIYSLGITLYHMLVGHPPYAGRATTEEIIADHLKGERLRPEASRPDIPRAVADLVRRMTRQNPEGRPTARQVLEILATKLSPERLGRRRTRGPVRRVRRGRKSQSTSQTLIVLGGIVVLLLILLVLLLKKSGASGGTEQGAVTPPVQPAPAPAPVEKTREPEPPIAKTLEQSLKDLLAQAKAEERTHNDREALLLYQRVVAKAPPESRYFKEARAAATVLRDRLEVERGRKKPPAGKTYITVEQSEQASKEFAERRASILKRMQTFRLESARKDLAGLKDRMRLGSAERADVEALLGRLDYLKNLIGVVSSRAAALSGERADWFSYDMHADPTLRITGASTKGLALHDEETGMDRTLAWAAIDPDLRVSLFEACRSAKSADEAVWMAYYCKLVGDDRAERYADFARMLDDTPARRAELKALGMGG